MCHKGSFSLRDMLLSPPAALPVLSDEDLIRSVCGDALRETGEYDVSSQSDNVVDYALRACGDYGLIASRSQVYYMLLDVAEICDIAID